MSKVNSKTRSLLLEVFGEFERNVNLNFTRIYPASGTDEYDKLFEIQRPNNKLLYKYLFEESDLSHIASLSEFDDLIKPL